MALVPREPFAEDVCHACAAALSGVAALLPSKAICTFSCMRKHQFLVRFAVVCSLYAVLVSAVVFQ